MPSHTLKSISKFLAATLVAGLFLSFIPFSQREVATQRLEQEVLGSEELHKKISLLCKDLLPNENTPLERWFISKIALKTENREGTSDSLPSCVLKAESTQFSHFYLLAQWSIGFQVFSQTSSTPLLNKTYSTQFPLPLSFLPLLTFILILPFNQSVLGAIIALFAHLLFLNGLNLIQALKNLPKTSLGILTTDRLFPGLLLFSLWLALRPLSERKQVKHPTHSIEAFLNSFLSSLLGVWNPIFYTLLGPLFFPLGQENKKIKSFLALQVLVLTLSLFLFGLSLTNIDSFFKTFLTPRYFSFSIFFCLLFYSIPHVPFNQPLLWSFKHFWKYVTFGILFTLSGFIIPELKTVSTLTQLALVFLVIEISSSRFDGWKAVWGRWKWPLGALLISSFVASYSAETGVVDLIVAICDPQKHPTAILLFALLSGFLISFVTGGLATPFFVLISQMVQAYPSPLIRAALFDGVLAGLVLSPFSLFNLYPAFQNRIPIQLILKNRAEQLITPLIMGSIIYSVGTISTLGILPSVSFVFCCLIVITLKLRKSRWKVNMFPGVEHSEPR